MHVSLISDESITELTQGTDFTVTDRVVTLAAATTLKIKIYRQTATKPLVGWADASVLKAADMTVQSTQLLHLAEETSDLAQDGGLSKDTTDNVWDAKFNKIKNLLDPTDPGDAVTLRYITKNQDSLLNQLKSTGAAQNAAIVATGDAQNARLTATGDTQNTRLTTTGDTQNTRLVTTGNSYVNTMTTLRDATTTKATEANNSADLAKKWAVSSSSPDGATDSKSSKTWAEAAKVLAGNAAASASAAQSSATASQNSANSSASSAATATQKATAAASSASAASSSASNAKINETNAANSAKAAKQSEENAKTWDPTQYVQSVTESNGKVTVTKGGGASTIINLIDTFYPIGSVYISADKSKTKADFPFMQHGTWEEIPANLCLQTGAAGEAGTQRSAGLPNITGKANVRSGGDSGANILASQSIGAIACSIQDSSFTWYSHISLQEGQNKLDTLSFNASNSNPIYGKSSTVQPPAYIVRAWVRTA